MPVRELLLAVKGLRKCHSGRTVADNIPEAVSSGLLICLLTWLIYSVSGIEISFDLKARDTLLVYFFAGIGPPADLSAATSA